ncbi:MAG: hypothetical protein M3P87_09870 [Actinomycetota bacterium]|nr:hypothetical protein [Actinomycetota bacterium]
MNRFGLVAIWVAATAITTVLAWQIVAAAGEQVSPGPLTPIAAPTATASTDVSSTSSSTVATSTTQPDSQATTATSVTTTPATGSTSSSAVAAWQVKTIPTVGGTVVVSYRPGEVVHDGSTPAAGFTVDVDKQGPPEVRVEFESETTKVEVRVRWTDQLVVDIQSDD